MIGFLHLSLWLIATITHKKSMSPMKFLALYLCLIVCSTPTFAQSRHSKLESSRAYYENELRIDSFIKAKNRKANCEAIAIVQRDSADSGNSSTWIFVFSKIVANNEIFLLEGADIKLINPHHQVADALAMALAERPTPPHQDLKFYPPVITNFGTTVQLLRRGRPNVYFELQDDGSFNLEDYDNRSRQRLLVRLGQMADYNFFSSVK